MINFFNFTQKDITDKIFFTIMHAYNDNLISLAVFGSYAEGSPRLNSDLDLFIILERVKSRSFEFNFFYENIEQPLETDLMRLFKECKIDMNLSPFIVSKEQAMFFNPLYHDMCEGCEIVYDKGNYFESILKKVSNIKKNHHFKKTPVANTFKWDMTKQVMLGQRL